MAAVAPGRVCAGTAGYQAIDTAIKASKNMSTPPTKGKTNGMRGTMASTVSASWSGVLGVLGADMAVPSVVKIGQVLSIGRF